MQKRYLPSIPDLHKSFIAIGTIFVFLICVLFMSSCHLGRKMDQLESDMREVMGSESEALCLTIKAYVDDTLDKRLSQQDSKVYESLSKYAQEVSILSKDVQDTRDSISSMDKQLSLWEKSIQSRLNDVEDNTKQYAFLFKQMHAKIITLEDKLDDIPQPSRDTEILQRMQDLETKVSKLEALAASATTEVEGAVHENEIVDVVNGELVTEPSVQPRSGENDMLEPIIVDRSELDELRGHSGPRLCITVKVIDPDNASGNDPSDAEAVEEAKETGKDTNIFVRIFRSLF